jgi:hypothetical protein
MDICTGYPYSLGAPIYTGSNTLVFFPGLFWNFLFLNVNLATFETKIADLTDGLFRAVPFQTPWRFPLRTTFLCIPFGKLLLLWLHGPLLFESEPWIFVKASVKLKFAHNNNSTKAYSCSFHTDYEHAQMFFSSSCRWTVVCVRVAVFMQKPLLRLL